MPKKPNKQTTVAAPSGSTLKATRHAQAVPQTPRVATSSAKATKKATPAAEAATAPTVSQDAQAARAGSKTSRVIELLKQEGGVTLAELMAEMGWQSHTTRALMSAGGALTKKHGLTVVSSKRENGDRVYSIRA